VNRDRIAILGGGMLGVCTALELARRGRRVTLIEGAADVLQGASRWSEGKIHLGFLYAGDPTLGTAKRLIPGGLAFAGLVSRILGRGLQEFATAEDEIFLVHRESVVDAAAFEAYAQRTASLVREAASRAGTLPYLTDASRTSIRLLSASELSEVTCSDEVIAGYRVPERSISTVAIANLMQQTVLDEPLVDIHIDTWVTGVRRRSDGRLELVTAAEHRALVHDGPFDVVINALWEGRPAVDATLGIHPPGPWSHRFRAAVFARGSGAGPLSAVLCTGPFGDVKRYADGRLYLSWYASGLLAQGDNIEPPRESAILTSARRDDILKRTLESLAKFFPAVRRLNEYTDEIGVNGGWVYAVGQGSLADGASTLHRRDRFNMTIDRGYISVDTAKYSIAPWLAVRIAEIVAPAS
jgi:glycine/D-amino acid oxidase-like deaminating enzyme